MSKTAKMVIDKDFQISRVDERIYGSSIWDAPYTTGCTSRGIRSLMRMDSART